MASSIGSLSVEVNTGVVEGCHIAMVSDEGTAVSDLDVARIAHKAYGQACTLMRESPHRLGYGSLEPFRKSVVYLSNLLVPGSSTNVRLIPTHRVIPVILGSSLQAYE